MDKWTDSVEASPRRRGNTVGQFASPSKGPLLFDQIRAAIRIRHYSFRTEETYVHWVRRFILFHCKRHPRDMGAPEVGEFLTHLAPGGDYEPGRKSAAPNAAQDRLDAKLRAFCRSGNVCPQSSIYLHVVEQSDMQPNTCKLYYDLQLEDRRMSLERPNCAVAKKLYDSFLDGDLEAIYALLDPRVEWEIVGSKEVPHFGVFRGLEEVKRFFSIIAQINQMESFEVLSYAETENGAYVECRERGHFKGHPRRFDMRSCHLLEIKDGRIVRFRIYQDTSQMVDAWRS